MLTRKELDELWERLGKLLEDVVAQIESEIPPEPESDAEVDDVAQDLLELENEVIDLSAQAFNAEEVGDAEEEERLLRKATDLILSKSAEDEAADIYAHAGNEVDRNPHRRPILFAPPLRNLRNKFMVVQNLRLQREINFDRKVPT